MTWRWRIRRWRQNRRAGGAHPGTDLRLAYSVPLTRAQARAQALDTLRDAEEPSEAQQERMARLEQAWQRGAFSGSPGEVRRLPAW